MVGLWVSIQMSKLFHPIQKLNTLLFRITNDMFIIWDMSIVLNIFEWFY
jgi:hypothetical protein